jgi:hypothetical protein
MHQLYKLQNIGGGCEAPKIHGLVYLRVERVVPCMLDEIVKDWMHPPLMELQRIITVLVMRHGTSLI